ncbi:2-5A-dependent ribonuclease [Penicillium cataractarum]|uniref:2-5A-dependent ribonuclease n=1 Tax=Penicillium cataractarum TaxID=2100454 RepID=A0A9W9VWM5_9EURO|nr:2-5A-dependent ribonuclease [Penicillium cataractarum]KAJ5390643.1 2-5A-dependent ribonuclease [Penicillium cataractarum]
MDWQEAIRIGNVEELRTILGRNSVEVNTRDPYGRTVLYMAVLADQNEIVKILLENNANPDIGCRCGTTPLSKAAELGNLDVLTFLLQKGAKLNTRNADGESPEDLAWHNGHEAVLFRINQHKIKRVDAFMKAAKKGCITEMQGLMASGVDLRHRDAQGDSGFDLAVQSGRVNAVRFLLQSDAGIDVSEPDSRGRGITPLHRAAQNGHEAVVSLLLEYGARPNMIDYRMMTPLHHAAQRGHTEVISTFWRYMGCGVPVELDALGRNGITPLMLAAKHRRTVAVNRLLELGADPSLKDGMGETAWDKWKNNLD